MAFFFPESASLSFGINPNLGLYPGNVSLLNGGCKYPVFGDKLISQKTNVGVWTVITTLRSNIQGHGQRIPGIDRLNPNTLPIPLNYTHKPISGIYLEISLSPNPILLTTYLFLY